MNGEREGGRPVTGEEDTALASSGSASDSSPVSVEEDTQLPESIPPLVGVPPTDDDTLLAGGGQGPPSEEDTLMAPSGATAETPAPRVVARPTDPTMIGRFRVQGRIGEGGMGLIFAAHDPELNRKVAVKLVRPALGGTGSEAPSRLLREAQSLARVSHRNVIHVYEVGKFEDQVYVAMEFVEGATLRAWQWREENDWRAVLDAYLEAARGLAAAHAAGMVHRDFKPDNVLVTRDGDVSVIDFGLARTDEDVAELTSAKTLMPVDGDMEVGKPETRLTRTGAILGTPAYMAPEQFEGKPTDARTDQFSFCVALYEALYGSRPFAGETYAILVKRVLDGELEPEPRFVRVPPWIRAVLLRGLQPDPERRYPSMDALVTDLRKDPALRRRRLKWIGAAVAAATLVAAGMGWRSSLLDARAAVVEEGRSLRSDYQTRRIEASSDLVGHVASGSPRRAWNRFVLSRAREEVKRDSNRAAAILLHLVAPEQDEFEQARALAARAGRRGLGRRVVPPGLPSEARVAGLHPLANGEVLLVDDSDGTVVWDPASDEVSWTPGSVSDPSAIGVAADGEVLLVGHDSGSLSIHSRAGGRPDRLVLGEARVEAIAGDATGRTFAVGSADGSVALVEFDDEAGWRVSRSERLHETAVRGATWVGEALVSGAEDGTIAIWKPRERKTRKLPAPGGPVSQVVQAAPSLAIVLDSEGRGRYVDVASGGTRQRCSAVALLSGGADGFVGFDDQGAVVCGDGERATHAPSLGSSASSAEPVDGGWLVLDVAGRLRLSTVDAAEDRIHEPDAGQVTALEFAGEGESLIVGHAGGVVSRVNVVDGAPLSTAELATTGIEFPQLWPSPSREQLLVSSVEGHLRLITLSEGSVSELSDATDRVAYAVHWNDSGTHFAASRCCDERGRYGIGVWTADGERVAVFVADHAGDNRALRLSPDAAQLYVDTGAYKSTFLHDLATGEAHEFAWQGRPRPEVRIAESWGTGQHLRVFSEADDGLTLWEQGPEEARMHVIDELRVESWFVDVARSACLFRAEADQPYMLWRLEDDLQVTLERLDGAPRSFDLSADRRWLVVELGREGQASVGRIIDLDTGRHRPVSATGSAVAVGHDGRIAAVEGAIVRIERPLATRDWESLQSWIVQHTDARVDVGQLRPEPHEVADFPEGAGEARSTK